MPFLFKNRLVTMHEPLRNMSEADLRDFALLIGKFVKSNPITVERKLRDIESELEWRRVAHTHKSA